MATNLNTVLDALDARLRDRVSDSFATITRNPRDYAPEQYPVLEILDGFDETSEHDNDATPPLWSASIVLGVVTRFPGKTDRAGDAPLSGLNGLVYAVKVALERQTTDHTDNAGNPGHYTNLGGLVESLSIGRIEKGGGYAAEEVWAKVPITVTFY